MHNLSRRKFLADSAVLAASAALGRAAFGMPPASEPHMDFPTEPRQRIAVSSWPFRAQIESPTNRWARKSNLPGMDLNRFVAMVAEKFNVHNIEPISDHFASTDPGYLTLFRAAVAKAESHVIDVPVSGRHSFYDPNAAKRAMAVAYSKQWVDTAATVGSPSVRLNMAGVKKVAPDVDLSAEGLRQVADHGAEKNVIINLENDDLKTEDAFFLVHVIEKANHPWLHALPDFCNSMLSGNEQFNYDAVTAMFKHAYNICHVKDAEMDGPKEFKVDLARSFGILKASGFRGYCSMEFEGQGDPYQGTQKLVDATLKYLSA